MDDLIELAKDGNQTAKTKIITKYDRYIKKFASRYFSNLNDCEDLQQIAREGILKAIDTYTLKRYKIIKRNDQTYIELDKNFKPPSFFNWLRICVRHKISYELRKENALCRQIKNFIVHNNIDVEDNSPRFWHLLDKTLELVNTKFNEQEALVFECLLQDFNLYITQKYLRDHDKKLSIEYIKRLRSLVREKINIFLEA